MFFRILLNAVAWRVGAQVTGTFGKPDCDFLTVDASTLTKQERSRVPASDRPLLVLNAFKWDDTMGTQKAFLDVFANVNVSTTSNVEFQSAWDHLYSATKTTFGAWSRSSAIQGAFRTSSLGVIATLSARNDLGRLSRSLQS